MATTSSVYRPQGGGDFLADDGEPADVFTREDLSPAQQMFGRVAEDFMRTQVRLLSRICGLILVQEGVPTCDRARFPSLRRCETHRIV